MHFVNWSIGLDWRYNTTGRQVWIRGVRLADAILHYYAGSRLYLELAAGAQNDEGPEASTDLDPSPDFSLLCALQVLARGRPSAPWGVGIDNRRLHQADGGRNEVTHGRWEAVWGAPSEPHSLGTLTAGAQ